MAPTLLWIAILGGSVLCIAIVLFKAITEPHCKCGGRVEVRKYIYDETLYYCFCTRCHKSGTGGMTPKMAIQQWKDNK